LGFLTFFFKIQINSISLCKENSETSFNHKAIWKHILRLLRRGPRLSYGQPRLSFCSSLSNVCEQEFVPCRGHHTHYQFTQPPSQLSRKKEKKFKNLLFWHLVSTSQTLPIWGGNSLTGASIPILHVLEKSGEESFGRWAVACRSCSLTQAL